MFRATGWLVGVAVFVLSLAYGANGYAADRNLSLPPAGDPSQRVLALWKQTKPIAVQDASTPHNDSEWLAMGRSMLATWTELQAEIADSDASGEARAVMKFMHDLYGREAAQEARRRATRLDVLQNFSTRVADLDGRLRD